MYATSSLIYPQPGQSLSSGTLHESVYTFVDMLEEVQKHCPRSSNLLIHICEIICHQVTDSNLDDLLILLSSIVQRSELVNPAEITGLSKEGAEID